MNNVCIIGRLTKAPEIRYMPQTQTAVASFTVAINRGKDRDGKDKGADFPRVAVFGRTAENCEKFLAKGMLVGVQGHLKTGSYKDEDGRTVYTTDVIADRVDFLEWRNKNGSGGTQSRTECPDDVPEGFCAVDVDDIPF